MAKKYHYMESDRPRIEIIPMIDIMMFLLVFFIMVTLKMIPASGVELDLPGASTAQKLEPTQIVIGVSEDGSMKVGEETMTIDQLTAYLKQKNADKTKPLQVIIAGDKQVSLQNLLAIMDVARAQGITGVGIATKEAK